MRGGGAAGRPDRPGAVPRPPPPAPGAARRPRAAATGLGLLLRARAYRGVGQRTWLVTGGAAVLLLTGASLATRTSSTALALLVTGALGLGLVGLGYALRAPKNQPSPYWGR